MPDYDAATIIRTYLYWYETIYGRVPIGMFEEIDLFVDEAEHDNVAWVES